ncbi:MAG: lysophospholipid acyltransferase family protein [Pseudomonadota bacterium]|nr:lysophospholipid acyltransferase family protein [Pseudomonadota bacterium]
MTRTDAVPVTLRLLKPRYWTAWLVVFLMWLSAWLPLSAKHRFGRWLGTVLKKRMPVRAATGRRNLTACFPEKSAAEIEQMLTENMQQMSMGALESSHAWWRDVSDIAARTRVIGLDHLLNAQAKGHGVLIMGGHFAAVDMILAVFADRVASDYELGYMYRPHDNPVIDRMIVNGRSRHGVRGFTKRQLKEMVSYIHNGGMAWYACDQHFRRASDRFAPFFGIQTANLSTPSWIARESGAAVVFMRMHRLPDGNFEYEFSPLPEGFGADPQQDCENWNRELEQAIRKYPAQYFWVHKRFKKRPPGEPEFY